MSHQRDNTEWIRRGSQRSAVARVLRKPMTATEICSAARQITPRIQLRDVWFLLRQFQERGLVTSPNPRVTNGRLHELTLRGVDAVREAFGMIVAPPPSLVDWRKYAQVVRARIRRMTLIQLESLDTRNETGQTAMAIRRQLRTHYPVGLNPILRAMKDLLRLSLVKEVGVTPLRSCRLYQLTPAGRRVAEQLRA